MIDFATLTALAGSAVNCLAPLLQKVLEKGAEEFGKTSAGALLEKFKKRLTHTGAQEALHDLAQQPSDADVQSALRVQLRKALENDAELATWLKKWNAEAGSATGTSHVATASGDFSKINQIDGSGNSVSM